MRQERLGQLDVTIAGGTDREGGGDGPIVVLLHGFGAAGDDLVPLWRVLDVPASTRFVFPEAPLELPAYGGGRAWWMIDLERMQQALAGQAFDRTDEEPEGIAQVRGLVTGMLDEMERQLGPAKVVLGGFSQGAMLACDVALQTARPLAGLVLLSGTLLMRPAWTAAAPTRRGLPVLQSHGRRDPLLSFTAAQRLRQLLVDAGLPVEWIEHPGAHEIPDPVLQALARFVARVG